MERRLVTIMAADVVGYSARMELSEGQTIEQLSALTKIIGDQVVGHNGRVFSRAGDGFLSEFPSPVMAVLTGFEIQRILTATGEDDPQRFQLRIGVHLADAVVDGQDFLGDGVNIAARVEGIAEPGSVLITQPVFDQVKRTAKLRFEDLGERYLKNISEPVRVYRVVGELENHSYITGMPQTLQENADEGVKPARPNSLAVVPFANFGGDPDQEYFSDGFTEDLITELSRFNQIFLISRNASFALKGRSMGWQQIRKQLGVAYCLEGSVRKLGSRIRIACQLTDTQTGDQVWAEKYDCKLDELYDVQDNLAASIVAMVAGRIEHQARVAAKRKKPADMLAHDCLLRGLSHHRLGGITRETSEKALQWFDLAIEKDPDFARAYAWRACALSTLADWTGQDAWGDVAASARRGLELDERDAECHRIAGAVSLHARDYGKAEYHYHRALDLNPNHAYVVGRMGELYNFLGDGETALKYQLRARQLDPFLPAYCRELEAVAYYVLGQYANTVSVVAQLSSATRLAAVYRVAAYTHLDDQSGLKRAVAELLKIDPDFNVNSFIATAYYKDQGILDQLHDDLKVGLKAR